jgi:hypothetical protein
MPLKRRESNAALTESCIGGLEFWSVVCSGGLMEKAKVLKVFEVNDETYQKVCTVIGLKNPPELSGGEIDSFEMVQGWLDRKECANAKEAIARFNEEKPEPSGISDAVAKALEGSRQQIETEVAEIYGQTGFILSNIKQQYISGIYEIAGRVLIEESKKTRPIPNYPLISETPAIALPSGDNGNGKSS